MQRHARDNRKRHSFRDAGNATWRKEEWTNGLAVDHGSAHNQLHVEQHGTRTTRSSAEAIATTEKDWTKLSGALADAGRRGAGACPVLRPALVMEFVSGEEALERSLLRAVAGEGVISCQPGGTGPAGPAGACPAIEPP